MHPLMATSPYADLNVCTTRTHTHTHSNNSQLKLCPVLVSREDVSCEKKNHCVMFGKKIILTVFFGETNKQTNKQTVSTA